MIGRGWWDDYRGIPYLDHGRGRDGLDCWGLVRLVYAERFGVALPSFAEDYECSDAVDLSIVEKRMDGWREVERPTEGDVVLIRIVRNRRPRFHIGVVVNPRRGEVLHISKDISVTVEQYRSPRWASRVVGFWRHDER